MMLGGVLLFQERFRFPCENPVRETIVSLRTKLPSFEGRFTTEEKTYKSPTLLRVVLDSLDLSQLTPNSAKRMLSSCLHTAPFSTLKFTTLKEIFLVLPLTMTRQPSTSPVGYSSSHAHTFFVRLLFSHVLGRRIFTQQKLALSPAFSRV